MAKKAKATPAPEQKRCKQINAGMLLKQIVFAGSSIHPNSVVSALECLCFDGGTVTGSDLNIYTMTKTDVEGSFLVNYKKFHQLLKQLEETSMLEIESGETTVKLITEAGTYELESYPVGDYPKTPDYGNTPLRGS